MDYLSISQLSPSSFKINTYVSINFVWGFVLGQLTIIFILTFVFKYWLLTKSHSKANQQRRGSDCRQSFFVNTENIINSNPSYFQGLGPHAETSSWLNITIEYLVSLLSSTSVLERITTCMNQKIKAIEGNYSYIKNIEISDIKFYNNKIFNIDKIKIEKDQGFSNLYLGFDLKLNDLELTIKLQLNIKNILKLPVEVKIVVYNMKCRVMIEPSIPSAPAAAGLMISIENMQGNNNDTQLDLALNTNLEVGKNKMELNNNIKVNQIIEEIVKDIIYNKMVFPNSIKIPFF